MNADGRNKIEGITRVEVSGRSTVRVRLTAEGQRDGFLMVEPSWDYRTSKFTHVRIHGGNTNDGTADDYERAARAYGQAVEIARLMERLIADPDDYFDGFGDDEMLLRGMAVGMPDYLCGLYLSLKDKSDGLIYDRGYGDDTSHDGREIVGLESLRERVLAVAKETLAQVSA